MHIFFDDSEIEKKLEFVFRPKKYNYIVSELGYAKQSLDDVISPRVAMQHQQLMVERTDFTAYNPRKEKLACSIYANKFVQCKDVIVVYLHGNAGTRLDSVPAVKFIVQDIGIDMCSFDFSGCGRSEGEFVSLGLKEQDDLQSVLEILISKYNYKKVILYGRSMGGVTSLLYCSSRSFAQKYVMAMVVDSPFCSLKKLATDLADEKVSFFGGFIAGMSFDYIRTIVKKMTEGYDIFSLELDKQVVKCSQFPALFCYSFEDKLIKHTHSEKLLASYGGKSGSFIFSGDHNAFRDDSYFNNIKKFIKDILVENKININLDLILSATQPVQSFSTSMQRQSTQTSSTSKTNLKSSSIPSQLSLNDKFQIYQQQISKSQIPTLNTLTAEQQLSLTTPSSSNNLFSLLPTPSNAKNMSPLSKSHLLNNNQHHHHHNRQHNYSNNTPISQFEQISAVSPNNHHNNNLHQHLHKQQSLPVHMTSINNQGEPHQTIQTLKKQQSFIQLRTPSEIASRISLCGQPKNLQDTDNELRQRQSSNNRVIIPEAPLQKSISNEATNVGKKSGGITQIYGMKKTPSQPLIFFNENEENKRVSLIDFTQSQRQASSISLIDNAKLQSHLQNKIQTRESLILPPKQLSVVQIDSTQNEKKRRQSIFGPINTEAINFVPTGVSVTQNAALQQNYENKDITIKQNPSTQKLENRSLILGQQQLSSRAVESNYMYQNHRQSIAQSSLPATNTSSNLNTKSQLVNIITRNHLNQEASKSITSLTSPFVSPRTVFPFQQSLNQVGNKQNTKVSNEIKPLDINIIQISQKSPSKAYLNQFNNAPVASSDKLQSKIASNQYLETNENYENVRLSKLQLQQPLENNQNNNQQSDNARLRSTLYLQQQLQIPPYEALLYKQESNKVLQNFSLINDNKSSQKTIRLM